LKLLQTSVEMFTEYTIQPVLERDNQQSIDLICNRNFKVTS
jgi:hypothetical protein